MAEFNPQQFIEAISNLALAVGNSVPGITQTVALDATALIKSRIQQTGLDADGNQLPPYSTTEVPAFFFYNKATNEGGRNIVKERQKEKRGLSYRDFKAANNGEESVSVTNITFTGDTFRSLGIVDQGQQGTLYIVKVGGRDGFSQNKIDWNSLRYGDILRVSKKEDESFQQTIDDELEKVIKQNGF